MIMEPQTTLSLWDLALSWVLIVIQSKSFVSNPKVREARKEQNRATTKDFVIAFVRPGSAVGKNGKKRSEKA